MKNTILRSGAVALILVMLLACFAACGSNMEAVYFNGIEINCPKDLPIHYNDGSVFLAMDDTRERMIQAGGSQKNLSEEELDELLSSVEKHGNAFGAESTEALFELFYGYADDSDIDNSKCSLVDPYTVKMTFNRTREADQKTFYATLYSCVIIDRENLTCKQNVIMVVEPSSDRSLGNEVLK